MAGGPIPATLPGTFHLRRDLGWIRATLLVCPHEYACFRCGCAEPDRLLRPQQAQRNPAIAPRGPFLQQHTAFNSTVGVGGWKIEMSSIRLTSIRWVEWHGRSCGLMSRLSTVRSPATTRRRQRTSACAMPMGPSSPSSHCSRTGAMPCSSGNSALAFPVEACDTHARAHARCGAGVHARADAHSSTAWAWHGAAFARANMSGAELCGAARVV